ncbi:hypothetical protein IT402_03010 [Candidatus Nomurabacteria bacterium]|nr:hypothetical protein [Candidatus Nomurabacteria bacterium]
MKNIGLGTKLFLIFFVFVALLIWASSSSEKSKEKRQLSMTSREAALLCTTDMATEFHIHPELKIIINGQEVQLPNNIGIKPGCMNSLHTHDSTGVLHVESPVKKDFVIGDFFAVWQKDFSKEKILDYSVSENSEILISVNGELVDTYENTLLEDKDKIVIEYKSK